VVTKADAQSLDRLREKLSAQVEHRLERQGAPRPRLRTELDVRYVGQAFEVTVPYTTRWARAFHARHRARFGFSDDTRDIEVLRLRVRGSGQEGGARARRLAPKEVRAFRARPQSVRAGIAHHRREDLKAGARVRGPAVIEETTATTWVPGAWQGAVLASGELVLEPTS